jgi:putative ABC transport system substrate-binding protein
MKRRDFLLAGALLAPVFGHALAQPAPKRRLALIWFGKTEEMKPGLHPAATAFFDELKRQGYVEGENLIIERWEYHPKRLIEIAREVVDANPDVIACLGSPMAARLQATTKTIPIVAMTGDPVRFGLISNIARPGGNLTGVSVDAGVEVWAKRLELLSSTVPKLRNVAFISSEGVWTNAGGQAVRAAADKLQISLIPAPLSSPYGEAEYRATFSSIPRDRVDGIMLSDEGQVLLPQLRLLVQLIRELRLPAIYPYRDFVEPGGLMAYASDVNANVRTQATQIGQIFKGAKPGDIPYFQAVQFELVLNLKTAKELGIEIPSGLIAAASAVVE